MPTLELGEPIEQEMLDFSADAAASRPHSMSNESLHRKETDPARVGRVPNRVTRGNVRLVGQIGPPPTGSVGYEAIPGLNRPIRGTFKRVFDGIGAVFLGVVFSPLDIGDGGAATL